MEDKDLFQLALGLFPPWLVDQCRFEVEQRRLDIHVNFPKGAAFPCPECGRAGCKAYDTDEQTWRHLNFFEHEAYIHARTPRVECPDCGVKTVAVPWARRESGFTLLFEAYVLALAKRMPVNSVAQMVGEHDTRIWRIIGHYVKEARGRLDLAQVTVVGMDETSSKRGHNYITLFVDMKERKVIFATEGKDAETVERFVKDLEAHEGAGERIREVSCDMSPAFISGIREWLAGAGITFDKFHVMQLISEAVDEVRRQEQKERPELKKTRYIWLKNASGLTEKQKATLERLSMAEMNLSTAQAYQMRLNFQEMYQQPPDKAEAFLREWCDWVKQSGLGPMVEVVGTIERHWDGILRWFQSRITNGVLEGINSLIQAAKAKARGYRNTKNLITIVYLIAGKLDFRLAATHTR